MNQNNNFKSLINNRQELSKRLQDTQAHLETLTKRYSRKSKFGYPKTVSLQGLANEIASYEDYESELIKRIHELEAELNWY